MIHAAVTLPVTTKNVLPLSRVRQCFILFFYIMNNRIDIEQVISQSKISYGKNELLEITGIHKKNQKTILYLHGHQIGSKIGGWEAARLMLPLITRGYRIVAPSLLGYGETTGEPDFNGPGTIDRLIETFLDSSQKKPVHLLGASRGASLALLLANKMPDNFLTISCVAGYYDLPEHYAQSSNEMFKKNVLTETGGSNDALIQRSPIYNLDNLTMPIWIFHGELDKQVPVEQAGSMHEKISKRNSRNTLEVILGKGHGIVNETVLDQIDKKIKSS